MIAYGVWWGGEKGVSGLESGLLIWVLCPSRKGSGTVKAGGVVLALSAVGVSAASAVPVGAWWGLVAVLWAGAEECGRWNSDIIESLFLVTCF